MLNVYCISGMGVDSRLFKNIKLNNCKVHHIKWETPEKEDSLSTYALCLSKQIDTSRPFALVGVSMGGMCSVEIAKELNPVKAFIISSCKKSDELSFKITFWKYFALHRLLTDHIYITCVMLVKKQFGVKTKEQSKKFAEMLKGAPPDYYNKAVDMIVNWKNNEVPTSIIQIHGTADKILPIKNIKNCNYIIEGGTHFMIVDNAKEISEIINKELEEVTG